MRGRFVEQVAVVTGGASGIGRAVAERFLSEGARVALWDVNAEGLQKVKAELRTASVQVVDITNEDAVMAAAAEVADECGRIDVLVNSAGVAGGQFDLPNYPLDDWMRCLQINVTGTFLCCKHVVPTMLARGYGRIVNLASMAGKDGTPRAPAYSASKSAIFGLTKSIAREYAGTEIRVNCVAPAAIETELFRALPEDRKEAARKRIPIGRVGQVDEIAAMIAWIASPECSFTTGAIFDFSGGRGAT